MQLFIEELCGYRPYDLSTMHADFTDFRHMLFQVGVAVVSVCLGARVSACGWSQEVSLGGQDALFLARASALPVRAVVAHNAANRPLAGCDPSGCAVCGASGLQSMERLVSYGPSECC
jgi:hypothetical protein